MNAKKHGTPEESDTQPVWGPGQQKFSSGAEDWKWGGDVNCWLLSGWVWWSFISYFISILIGLKQILTFKEVGREVPGLV